MLATLHSFLNVYTARGPWTVLIALNVYLTGLTTLNVYLTGVLQYFFLRFFYTMLSAMNMGNIVLHQHYRFTGWCFLVGSMDVAYCCLIQLCKVEVLQLQLDLSVLVHWFVFCCLLLFASTLQGLGPASAAGPVVAVCMVRILHPRSELRFCHSPLKARFQCHGFLPIHCLLFSISSLQVQNFNTRNAWVKILLQNTFVCDYYDQRNTSVMLSWSCS